MNKILNDIKELIEKADCILIGAGSGLSTAAGIDYAGDKITESIQKSWLEIDNQTSLFER